MLNYWNCQLVVTVAGPAQLVELALELLLEALRARARPALAAEAPEGLEEEQHGRCRKHM